MEKAADFISVQVTTWNVNKRPPSGDVTPLLGLDLHSDVVAIGLQEVTARSGESQAQLTDKWTDTLTDAMLHQGYHKIQTVSRTGHLLNVYTLRRHVPAISEPTSSVVKAGIRYPVGQKGGATLNLLLYGQSLGFVSSHLTHSELFLESRIEDFHLVEDGRNNPQEDYTFWMGDLNFRLMEQEELTAEKILDMLEEGRLDELLQKDELLNLKRQGVVFSSYNEMPIHFKPTYKFMIGSSTYDLARRPAWTDRVLYKTAEGKEIKPIYYYSIDHINASDHKPVQALFHISVDMNS